MALRDISACHSNQARQAPHDETGERMFTIMGSAKANETALFLLYENLEAEKMRRQQQAAQASE
jgi:heterogeneous nuclear rnp K-like protein 2